MIVNLSDDEDFPDMYKITAADIARFYCPDETFSKEQLKAVAYLMKGGAFDYLDEDYDLTNFLKDYYNEDEEDNSSNGDYI